MDEQAMLETSKAERSVWLMKTPQLVAQTWHNHANSPHPVAKVILSVDPLQDVSCSLQFDMELMCIFRETSQGRVSVEGKVEHKFDMKPNNENIEEYRKLCRERTNKSMIRSRQVQVVDNDRAVLMRPMPGMVGLLGTNSKVSTSQTLLHGVIKQLHFLSQGVSQFSNMMSVFKDKKKLAPVKGQEMKRTRRDRGELENIMFKLFERQPNWALKQLVQETDQPAQFLKEILNELCIYNKRGTNQGTYELKPEYKKSVEIDDD